MRLNFYDAMRSWHARCGNGLVTNHIATSEDTELVLGTVEIWRTRVDPEDEFDFGCSRRNPPTTIRIHYTYTCAYLYARTHTHACPTHIDTHIPRMHLPLVLSRSSFSWPSRTSHHGFVPLCIDLDLFSRLPNPALGLTRMTRKLTADGFSFVAYRSSTSEPPEVRSELRPLWPPRSVLWVL
jgi:hypothetical protein